ncbi:hypothetical protein I4U23_021810 [Adineta vaga]|nr:hypothetical protein I4U23_021810 [Adineta vaga]
MDTFNIKQLIGRVCPRSSQPIEKILDVGCGQGSVARQLVQDGVAKFVVGADVSKDMIRLAIEASKEDNENYKYLVQDVRDLTSNTIGGTFPIVISIYVLQYAQTTDDLFSMLSGIRRVCSEFFVGIIPNPFFLTHQAHKFNKYGLKVLFPDQLKDGTSFSVTFDFDKPNSFTVTNFWYTAETYENMFRKAGFRTFEWVDMHVNTQATEEQKVFFADFAQKGIGFVAGV